MAFCGGNFKEKRLRQKLGIVHCNAHIQPRQEDREKKCNVLEPADECGVKWAVCVIVDGLEILDKEIRNIDRRGCAVNQDADPALTELPAERIRAFGDPDALEDRRTLEIARQISCREDVLQVARGEPLFDLVQNIRVGRVFQVADRCRGMALLADRDPLELEVGRLHAPAYKGDVDEQRLNEALA